jgi:hypothetical protein
MLAVTLLELGAHLLSTALGLNFTLTLMLGGKLDDAVRALVVVFPVVAVALLAAACLEVHMLRSQMPAGLHLPANVDLNQLRATAVEMIKRRSGGADPPRP